MDIVRLLVRASEDVGDILLEGRRIGVAKPLVGASVPRTSLEEGEPLRRMGNLVGG